MYPGLLAIHKKKSVYRIHRGGFDEESISSFLGDMLVGKGRNSGFKFVPTLDGPELKVAADEKAEKKADKKDEKKESKKDDKKVKEEKKGKSTKESAKKESETHDEL
jgi:hypothetical protein